MDVFYKVATAAFVAVAQRLGVEGDFFVVASEEERSKLDEASKTRSVKSYINVGTSVGSYVAGHVQGQVTLPDTNPVCGFTLSCRFPTLEGMYYLAEGLYNSNTSQVARLEVREFPDLHGI